VNARARAERSTPSSALSTLFPRSNAGSARPVAPPPLPRPRRICLATSTSEAFTSTATFATALRPPTIDGPLGSACSDSSHVQKLRVEIASFGPSGEETQTELQIERQYNQALETQIRTLTEVS